VRIGAVEVDGGVPLKVSRLGGAPVLPGREPWPRWGRRPLDFLGVLDFAEIAEVAPIAWLPRRGNASFYYAARIPRPWGDDPAEFDGWRVLPAATVEAPGAPGDAGSRDGGGVAATAIPPGEVLAAPEVMLYGAAFLSLPGPMEPALRGIGEAAFGFGRVYEEVYRAWVSCVWPDGLPRHQIGGWPVLVQRPLWEGCEQGWRLLLQLDSDDRLGWFWGDEGRVYFSMPAGGVAGGDLRRCWLTLQSR
jgi:uncharacterized protein DUF1963